MSTAGLPDSVIKQIIAEESPYNYIPSKSIAIIFVTLFGLSTLVHLGQAIRYRTWWIFPTVILGGLLEVLGWSGRLWSSISPLNIQPFQMQITATILGPTPILAANFVIFGEIIQRVGQQYSRLSPKWYTIIFATCDVVSLVVQGVGGGMAATADTPVDARRGGNIMLGGIVFQLLVIVVFSFTVIEFFVRYHKRAPVKRNASSETVGATPQGFTTKLSLMSYALGFVTLVLFIRAIYRTIELADGWNGRIISTQVYFNVLDGAMVVLAIYTFNFVHPGMMIPYWVPLEGRPEPKEPKDVNSA